MKKIILLAGFAMIAGAGLFAMDVPGKLALDLTEQERTELNDELSDAAGAGNKERVQELLLTGANPDYLDMYDRTPLMRAATPFMGQHPEVVRILLEAGASVDQVNKKFGETALQQAVRDRREKTIPLLISAGANVNHVDKNGNSVLETAVESVFAGNESIVSFLISSGADVNLEDPKGNTLLMRSMRDGREKAAEILIHNGADLYHVNHKDKTALMLAANRCSVGEALPLFINALLGLTEAEKDSVKSFLQGNKMLQKEGKVFLPKDPRILAAQSIVSALAERLRDRVIRAGCLQALAIAKEKKCYGIVAILVSLMKLDFLQEVVRGQITRW
jgi:hypothetical protein